MFEEEPIPEVLKISLEQLVLRLYLMHGGKRIDLHKILGIEKTFRASKNTCTIFRANRMVTAQILFYRQDDKFSNRLGYYERDATSTKYWRTRLEICLNTARSSSS